MGLVSLQINKRKVIEDLIDRDDKALLDDGSMIFHNINNNQFSALDWVLLPQLFVLILIGPSMIIQIEVIVFLSSWDSYAENMPPELWPKWMVEAD